MSEPLELIPITNDAYIIQANISISEGANVLFGQYASIAYGLGIGDSARKFEASGAEWGCVRIVVRWPLWKSLPQRNDQCANTDKINVGRCTTNIDDIQSNSEVTSTPNIFGWTFSILGKPDVFETKFWSMGRGEFSIGNSDGLIGGAQHSVSGPPKSSGKCCYYDCGDTSNECSTIIKGFSDLPSCYQNYVIRGAITLNVCGGLLAYFSFKWAEHQDADYQKHDAKQKNNRETI